MIIINQAQWNGESAIFYLGKSSVEKSVGPCPKHRFAVRRTSRSVCLELGDFFGFCLWWIYYIMIYIYHILYIYIICTCIYTYKYWYIVMYSLGYINKHPWQTQPGDLLWFHLVLLDPDRPCRLHQLRLDRCQAWHHRSHGTIHRSAPLGWCRQLWGDDCRTGFTLW